MLSTDVKRIIPISGKDSLTAAFVQTAHEPGDYSFFFTDLGTELPETYEWLDRVEAATGWQIERVGVSLLDLIRQNRVYGKVAWPWRL
jgi:3'-phosphoadenosine 5'-phosphosulfate sulfotransferase (PAPS reductase)/FAD synthetase